MVRDTFTSQAAADLSAKQYHLVRLSAAGQVNISSLATTSAGCGVLVNKPTSGQFASVRYGGIDYVVYGAATSANAWITCNGSGRAIAAGSGDMVYGRAIAAASQDGDTIKTLLFPPFRLSGAA